MMPNNLPTLLAELSERAPEVCKSLAGSYEIGVYRFWIGDYDELYAVVFDADNSYAVGQPALDWLQCALQRAIEVRGWYFLVERWPTGESCIKIALTPTGQARYTHGDNATESLLTALIAAIKGEVVK
jgi:hypothetical protein